MVTGVFAAVLLANLWAVRAIAWPMRGEDTPAIEFLNSGKILVSELPFSEAVRVGNLLFLSGQIGTLPGTTKLVPGGIKEEARQTMENIRTSLRAHGYDMSDIVKCTVMLADMAEWGAFNEVYQSFFSKPYPVRSAFGTSGLALGARVEVECIAAKAKKTAGGHPPRKKTSPPKD